MRKSLLALTLIGILSYASAGGNCLDADYAFCNAKQTKGGYGMNERGAHSMKLSFLRELDLTASQKERINSFKEEMFSKMETTFNNISETKAYFGENSFNKSAFTEDKKAVANAMVDIRADYIEKIYSVLTDDQKRRIPDIISKKYEKNKK
jgi:Spy/CpxP family protein refolding chaperone